MKKIQLHPAARIALAYALLAGLWVIFSDRILIMLVHDASLLTLLQTYKGWAFTGFTAILLYAERRQAEAESRRYTAQLEALHQEGAELAEKERHQRGLTEALAEAATAVNSTLDPDQVLDRLLVQVSRVVPSDATNIMLVQGDEAHVVRWRGYERFGAEEFISQVAFRVPEIPSLRQMKETAEPIIISDTVNYAGWVHIPPIQEWLRSYAAAPIIVRGKLIGFLNVDSSFPGFFTQAHLGPLRTFADYAASAMENARLYEEARWRTQEQETMTRIARALNALDVRQAFPVLSEGLRVLVDCDRVSVALLDETGEHFTMNILESHHPVMEAGTIMPVSATATREDVLAGRLHLTPDLSAEVDWPAERVLYQAGFRARINLPLVVGGRVLGALNLASSKPGVFWEGRLPILEQVADALAIAIENGRLFRLEREQRELAERLQKTTLLVNSSLDLREVLEMILDQLARVVPYDSGAIHILEPDATCVIAVQNLPPEEIGHRYPLDQYPYNRQLAQGNGPIIVRDAHEGDGGWVVVEGLEHVRANIGVSLQVRDRVIGILTIDSRQPGAYTETDAHIAQAFAQQAAIAIENARLYTEQHRRASEAGTLLEIANAINSTLELDDILKEVTLRAAHACEANRCAIFLLDEQGKTLIPIMAQFASGQADSDLWQLFKAASYPHRIETVPMVHQTIQERRPLFLPDALDSSMPRSWVEAFGVRSVLITPLISRERAVGVMTLDRPEASCPFTSEQVNLAMTIGGQAAVAIENARLYQETARRLAQTRVLREVMLVAASTLDFDQVLERACETLRTTMQVEFLGVVLPDEHRKGLWPHPALIGYPKAVTQVCILLDQSVCGRVFQTGNAMLIGDVREIPYYYNAGEGVLSELAIPVSVGRQVIGVLNVESRRLNAFDEEDMAFYTAIAGQLGVALENARLYQEVCRHADKLADALTKLRELDNLKNEFIQNVSHELRSPLSLVRGYADLLVSGELGELTSKQQEAAQIIARRGRMLSELVEDITLILQAETRPLAPTPVALGDLAHAAAEDFQVAIERAKLKLRTDITPNLPWVNGETMYLRRALDNLLANAIKFTPAGGTITVRVRQQGDYVVMEVSDTGIGIPPDQHERIFERFYQVDGSSRRRYSGVGIGLALVKEIVETHHGHVAVESQLGQGSTFTVSLPVSKG